MLVAHLFDLVFGLFEGEVAGFLHRREVEERGVAVEGVDKVGETGEGDAVVFAVEFLEGGVDFEDVGEGAGALEAELLI